MLQLTDCQNTWNLWILTYSDHILTYQKQQWGADLSKFANKGLRYQSSRLLTCHCIGPTCWWIWVGLVLIINLLGHWTPPLISQQISSQHSPNCQVSQHTDMHLISLYTKTQLISYFTDLSDISKIWSSLLLTYPNKSQPFPSPFKVDLRIPDSAQLHFSSLSLSTWFYMLSDSIPCCITPFQIISDWLSNYFNTLLSVSPGDHSVNGLGISQLTKYGVCAYIHLWDGAMYHSDAFCTYTLVIILYPFYFQFIFSILHILPYILLQ